jgi:hypothetical protein
VKGCTSINITQTTAKSIPPTPIFFKAAQGRGRGEDTPGGILRAIKKPLERGLLVEQDPFKENIFAAKIPS